MAGCLFVEWVFFGVLEVELGRRGGGGGVFFYGYCVWDNGPGLCFVAVDFTKLGILAEGEVTEASELQDGKKSGHDSDQSVGLARLEEAREGKVGFCFEAFEDKLHAVCHSHGFGMYLANSNLFCKAAKDLIEGIPDTYFVGRLKGALFLSKVGVGEIAGQEVLGLVYKMSNVGSGVLKFFVFNELADEFPTGVCALFAFVLQLGLLVFWEQHTALNEHEGSRHHKKIARDFEIHALHAVEDIEILIGNFLDRDIVDIYFVFTDEEKKQIKRTFKGLKANRGFVGGDEGVCRHEGM